ncbi:serine/threonine-protein kinase RIO3 [Megachile rotundata]|uniref:serine/threonine-protein kinase RIO3 n=1 Tax=Megachile rotundata TaxID=143995 RepID=UPI000258F915|nr:PREDICTED: serine/threonine-protein kinase RIO3-like [Megachile rotundata]XP_012150945.1 PREDICTED: serine/threonine-protein kinase RIO3-like [Megachile rotundata]XP_012150946.1 PREDICTED: serine/threonine-protein kinase RIO3-like [Megachile rotundata]
MSTPWAKIQPVEGPISLLEITSEQLASSLQEKEIKKYQNEISNDVNIEDCTVCECNDTDNDEVIAHMLQDQYNKEHDEILKRTEEKFNRDAKVNITYANYRVHSFDNQDDKDKDIDDATRDFDRFVSIEKEYASIPRCGYKKMGEGSQIVTKHDMLMSSRINACRVLQFPPGIDTGDTGRFDVKLNNNVFNSLRAHSHAKCYKRKPKAKPHTK